MGNNELLLKILNKKENFIKRYQHLETIERFFSMREIIDPEIFCLKDGKYRGRINSQINMFLKSRVNLDKKSIEEYKNLFEESIEKVFMVFGDEGFRQFIDGKYFYNINRSVAEMQLVVLSFIDKKDVDKNKREIRECFEELMMSDDKFVEAFKRATNNSKMVNYRYNVWGSAVKKVLK
ncbi:MAG TPA: hypothetical protein DCY94_00565 [Firmicutes bacterium]|nr:hypothetical protein [Bacillota bacterium]